MGSAQVAGVYQLDLGKGSERLELKVGGTYVQDTLSQSKSIHHTGQWHLNNHFLDGSEVVLVNAVITPVFSTDEQEKRPRGVGELAMYVHNRSGRIALARNEVADWYYERTQ